MDAQPLLRRYRRLRPAVGTEEETSAGAGVMTAIYWNRERIIESLQQWYAEHGQVPAKVADWGRAGPHHPSASSVDREFGSWNAAVVAAGLRPNRPGNRPRQTRDEMADSILDWYMERGSWPTKVEWDASLPVVSTQVFEREFGSWLAARSAAGWRRRCRNCDAPLPPIGRARPRRPRRLWCSERCRRQNYRAAKVSAVPTSSALLPRGQGDQASLSTEGRPGTLQQQEAA